MKNNDRIIVLYGILSGFRGVIEEICKNGFLYCDIENWGHHYLRPHDVELEEREDLWSKIVNN